MFVVKGPHMLDALAIASSEFSFIGIASFFGVLTRLLITAGLSTTTSSGAVVQVFKLRPFVLSNVLGCALAAFTMQSRRLWELPIQAHEGSIEEKEDEGAMSSPVNEEFSVEEQSRHTVIDDPLDSHAHNPQQKERKPVVPELFAALTLGYCGCLTTFSALIVSFLQFREPLSTNAINLLFEIALCGAAWRFGSLLAELFVSIASLLQENGQQSERKANSTVTILERNAKAVRVVSCFVFIISFLALWLLIAVVDCEKGGSLKSVYEINRPVERLSVWQGLRAIALAPIGAFVRYAVRRLALWRGRLQSLPLCTLSCNILGVVFSSLLVLFVNDNSWKDPLLVGFAGSLTTVSTFFADLSMIHNENGSLGVWYALRYGLNSFVPALLVVELLRYA